MRLISIVVAAVQIYFVTFYYTESLLLLSILGLSAVVLLWSYSFSKQAIAMFLIIGTLGFVAEAIVVSGGNAWTYHTQHLFGLPVWLPILWGSVGVFCINLVNQLRN